MRKHEHDLVAMSAHRKKTSQQLSLAFKYAGAVVRKEHSLSCNDGCTLPPVNQLSC